MTFSLATPMITLIVERSTASNASVSFGLCRRPFVNFVEFQLFNCREDIAQVDHLVRVIKMDISD